MPRVRKRKTDRGNWQEESLFKALQSIMEKKSSIRAAAKKYDIPMSTLRRKLNSKNFFKSALGPPCQLGMDVEFQLVNHIKSLQAAGFVPTPKNVRKIAYDMAQKRNIKVTFNHEERIAGKDWFKSFTDRHGKYLSIKRAQGFSLARKEGLNREETDTYFKLLGEILIENDLLLKPANIFNVDETELKLNNISDEVNVACGSTDILEIPSSEKDVAQEQELKDGMPKGSVVKMNRNSASSTPEIFQEWLIEHFIPRKPAGKCLLLLDGDSSHMDSSCLLETATENDIVLLCLPGHGTHFLQPLERCFFDPLKTCFQQECAQWILDHPNREITCCQFGELLHKSWSTAATAEIGVSCFHSTGVYPYDPNKIPDYAFVLTSDQRKKLTEVQGQCSLSEVVYDFYIPPALCSQPVPSTSTLETQAPCFI